MDFLPDEAGLYHVPVALTLSTKSYFARNSKGDPEPFLSRIYSEFNERGYFAEGADVLPDIGLPPPVSFLASEADLSYLKPPIDGQTFALDSSGGCGSLVHSCSYSGGGTPWLVCILFLVFPWLVSCAFFRK